MILAAKGIPFGILSREDDGSWDVSQVTGISARSLTSSGPDDPPDLIIRPFHQSGTVISLREFTNGAFNHHHGMQAGERFGDDVDADGDGVVNELNRADISAVVLYQATLPVPGRVIPNDPLVEQAILDGERLFTQIGCAACHAPSLALEDDAWIFTEPNPFNPALNLRPEDTEILSVDLTDPALPGPRPAAHNGQVTIALYTDFKLHDITSGADDPNTEPLDLNRAGEGDQLFEGNSLFLTARLWGVGNQPPYFHHGKFTTLRQAILAHAGEARLSRQRFEALDDWERDAVVEFLKSLQVLPPGSTHLVVDEEGNAKVWPPTRR
ncbi:MAG: di-heme oxidoredictase family protein [Caldilineaceae bacterium]